MDRGRSIAEAVNRSNISTSSTRRMTRSVSPTFGRRESRHSSVKSTLENSISNFGKMVISSFAPKATETQWTNTKIGCAGSDSQDPNRVLRNASSPFDDYTSDMDENDMKYSSIFSKNKDYNPHTRPPLPTFSPLTVEQTNISKVLAEKVSKLAATSGGATIAPAGLLSENKFLDQLSLFQERTIICDRTVKANVNMTSKSALPKKDTPSSNRRDIESGGASAEEKGQQVSHEMAAVIGDFFNEAMTIDQHLTKKDLDWRGRLTDRYHPAFNTALEVIKNARILTNAIGHEIDCNDKDWKAGPMELISILMGHQHQHQSSSHVVEKELLAIKCMALIEEAKRIISEQPVLINVPRPAKIFGDVHGQFRDLLFLFHEYGFPDSRDCGDIETVSYVFNGDFVDRGAHQLETVILLFALKVAFPSRVFLNRGNHEFRDMNKAYGFENTCRNFFSNADWGSHIYDQIHEVFDYLPIGCLVAERIFVTHGGIGDGKFTLDQARQVERPIKSSTANPIVHACMWSDPNDGNESSVATLGISKGSRGLKSVVFGRDCTTAFCERNNIDLVIRSHQFVKEGFKIGHQGHILTVFSARNYNNDMAENDSALIVVTSDEDGDILVRAKSLQRRI